MKYRPARGGLAAAMRECVTLEPTHAALVAHLAKRTGTGDVRVEYYCGADERVGWPVTYLVLLNGYPVGYTDGPVT